MADVFIPIHAIKGRGTATRMAHRFEKDARVAYDDGWGTLEEAEAGDKARLETEVMFEDARSAITHNDSPDIFFDYGLNPYRGCEHGCVYCYARPTHSYLNLSPGSTSKPKSSPSATLPRCCEPTWPNAATSPGCSTSVRPRTVISPLSASCGSRAA